MHWVTINDFHINLCLVREFHWNHRTLCVNFIGDLRPETFPDPDRKLYEKICNAACVSPAKEGGRQ